MNNRGNINSKDLTSFLKKLLSNTLSSIEQIPPRTRKFFGFLGGFLFLLILASMFFTVDITEYGLVKRFGSVRRVLSDPGLKVKLPYPIDSVQKISRSLFSFQPATVEYLTQSKNHIAISNIILWRIIDPKKFVETFINKENAEVRLADVVSSEIGSTLGTYPLSAMISTDSQEFQFGLIVSEIQKNARKRAWDYGIDITDVRLVALNFPEQNKQSVFERMIAERGRIATKYRSEGEMESVRIIAEAEREKTRRLAEAYRDAEKIRASGDAEAMRIYLEAFGKNPQFYKFLRTLEAYDKILDIRTLIFFPADADIFKLLNDQERTKPGVENKEALKQPTTQMSGDK
jgi:membrane protease subunit HflC